MVKSWPVKGLRLYVAGSVKEILWKFEKGIEIYPKTSIIAGLQ